MDNFVIRKNDCVNQGRNNCINRRSMGIGNHLGINPDLNRYYLNRHIESENHKYDHQKNCQQQNSSATASHSSDCSIAVNDLLETNALIQKDPVNQINKLPDDRFFKFVTSYIQLNSACSLREESTQIKIIEEVRKVLPPDDERDILPYYPKCQKIVTTNPNIILASTIGGETQEVIRNGDITVRNLSQLPDINVNINNCQDIVCPDRNDCICTENNGTVCPEHNSNVCPCLLSDERLDRIPKEKNKAYKVDQISAYQIIANNQQPVDLTIERDYMGKENLLAQVNLEGGLGPVDKVPLLECDPNLVIGQNNQHNQVTQGLTSVNTCILGGLKQPLDQTVCLYNNTEANRFYFRLDKHYQNVKIVKLVSSIIPKYDTIINQYNNKIIFQLQKDDQPVLTSDGSDIWEYSIPLGDYTVTELAELINEDLEALLDLKIFQIKVNRVRNTFQISVVEPYTFTWEFIDEWNYCRSLAKMLGFRENKQITYTDLFVNSDRFNLRTDDYLLVRINTLATSQFDHNPLFDCSTKQYYFNKINLRFDNDGNRVYDSFLDIEAIFENSDGSFDTIDLSVFNQDGFPIDLGDCEFHFTLMVVEYSDRLTGQNLNTRRGFIDYTSYIPKSTIQRLN